MGAVQTKTAEMASPIEGYNIDQVATVVHETNAAFCRTIGDYSQKPWEQASEWQRHSAIKGVLFYMTQRQRPGGPQVEAQHENWRSDKIKDGWVYGPVKNEETKEHPCMVPFDELPPEQKAKDFLFQAVVEAFTRAGLIG